ncbi:ATP-binding protein [Streptomyces sp. NPDC005529]|uniref:ATP-binding protein n=1 Tax=unclassified Streptomyces TaxID=2593676 RepID=UPI0033A56D5F
MDGDGRWDYPAGAEWQTIEDESSGIDWRRSRVHNLGQGDSGLAAGGPTGGAVLGGWAEGFAGRSVELSAVDDCRKQTVAGSPWLVVVQGEAGIGKTALARRAVAPGQDRLRVCWVGCDLAEQEFPYGVVDQILRRLPPDTAGVSELVRSLSPSASPLSVGSGLLTALGTATDTAPVALVVDDIQWADSQSLQVLAFVLRRLYVEPILTLITARSAIQQDSAGDSMLGPDAQTLGEWQTLTRSAANVLPLQLAGLETAEVAQLTEMAGVQGLGTTALERLKERTAGHPLHLRSLLTQVTRRDLEQNAKALPLPESLGAIVSQALTRMPDDTRRLVEALAVLDTPTPLIFLGRLAGITDPSEALGPALASGLVQWQPDQPTAPVRIHHRLQRDAIYQTIAPAQRCTLHTLAATLVGEDTSWAHQVAATIATDPALAGRLSAEADRQAAQNRHERAATLELWASNLVASRDQHEHHLLSAATHLCLGYAEDRAQLLRADIERCAPGPRRDAVLGRLASLDGSLNVAEQLLTHAMDTAQDPDTQAFATLELGSLYIGRAYGAQAAAVLRPLIEHFPLHSSARVGRGLLAFAAGYTHGPQTGLDVIAEIDLPQHAVLVPSADSPLLHYRGFLRILDGQLTAGADDLTTLEERQNADSHVPVFADQYFAMGISHYLAGRWETANICVEQALTAAESLGQSWTLAQSHALAAISHGQQGHEQGAGIHLDALARHGCAYPELSSFFDVLSQAALAQSRGDYPAMLTALRKLNEPGVPTGMTNIYLLLWSPLTVEAASHPGALDLDQATHALGRFDGLVPHAPALTLTSQWLHGRLAAAHGDTVSAFDHYRAGLALPEDGTAIPLHRAFLHRDLAALLHSTTSPTSADAAQHLRHAHDAFTALGAAPYVRRTADGLDLLPSAAHHDGPLRTGAVQKPAGQATGLTEREENVAHLAAQGYTNQEIAHDLFISPKTVEYHLGHIFTKLNVTNRRQLRTSSL